MGKYFGTDGVRGEANVELTPELAFKLGRFGGYVLSQHEEMCIRDRISRGAINKIGNMLYDYGNSVWLASMGTIGKTVLGIYQISELVTGILVNPFGGVISDRFSRRKILMTTDLVCGLLCLAISFITNDSLMIAALIFANIVQAIAFGFSRPANKAIITEVVEKEEIVTYNAHLELVLQLSLIHI